MKIIGVNKRCYPMQEGIDGRMEGTVTVVLVAGSNNDYVAYAGIGSDEWVARYGDKLSFLESKIHFPSIIEEKYRL